MEEGTKPENDKKLQQGAESQEQQPSEILEEQSSQRRHAIELCFQFATHSIPKKTPLALNSSNFKKALLFPKLHSGSSALSHGGTSSSPAKLLARQYSTSTGKGGRIFAVKNPIRRRKDKTTAAISQDDAVSLPTLQETQIDSLLGDWNEALEVHNTKQTGPSPLTLSDAIPGLLVRSPQRSTVEILPTYRKVMTQSEWKSDGQYWSRGKRMWLWKKGLSKSNLD